MPRPYCRCWFAVGGGYRYYLCFIVHFLLYSKPPPASLVPLSFRYAPSRGTESHDGWFGRFSRRLTFSISESCGCRIRHWVRVSKIRFCVSKKQNFCLSEASLILPKPKSPIFGNASTLSATFLWFVSFGRQKK